MANTNVIKEKGCQTYTNRTPDGKICGSGDGGVEGSVNGEMDNDAFKGPAVPGMNVDKALMLIKTKPYG